MHFLARTIKTAKTGPIRRPSNPEVMAGRQEREEALKAVILECGSVEKAAAWLDFYAASGARVSLVSYGSDEDPFRLENPRKK